MRVRLCSAALLTLALAASANAEAPASCPGEAITPDRVITGSFGAEVEGDYVMVPFEVPPGTTQVRVKYCYDQPDQRLPENPLLRPGHTLDLGIYDTRRGPLWDEEEFRGWGGSSHRDVQITAQGFPPGRANVPGRTTKAYVPGPVTPGEWAVELGVAAITTEGDLDDQVAWRVEIEFSDDPSFRADPYVPARFDEAPARATPGWYAGDLHVHAEHSSLNDASMKDTFDYAFGAAGLDFMTLSDYVTTAHYGEIGRHQARYPGKQIIRSAEVITYRGHFNKHATTDWADYRLGELRVWPSLEVVRGPQTPASRFAEIRAAGGFTQINHPTIFPSAVPTFSSLCRGCSWDYTPEETDYQLVDAIEIATGPAGLKTDPGLGPNPFTPLALAFYDDALDTGAHIAAIGVSDSHKAGAAAGNVLDITGAPIGMATTVVYAEELSERGIAEGVRAGHTYVKVWGAHGPDIRLEALDAAGKVVGIMGDTVAGNPTLRAKVLGARKWEDLNAEPLQMVVFRDRLPALVVPIVQDDQTVELPTLGTARYRIQIQRGTSIEAVSSPIWVTGA